MVVERIFQAEMIKRHPCLISAVAFLFVCISVLLAVMTHSPPLGFFIIALTVMPAIPFFVRMTICEEKGEEMLVKFISAIPAKNFEAGKKGLVSLYNNLIKLYTYFFLGCVVGFAFTSSVIPGEYSKVVFSDIWQILSTTSPQPVDLSFWGIFFHNFKLMLIMVFFSLVYSIGAIFLLVLNAAIIGVVVLGEGIRTVLPDLASLGSLAYPSAFVTGSLEGILRLLPHGICEFSAFFIASVAGGLFSVAIERKAYKRMPVFRRIVLDVLKLLVLATLLLAAGAFIEAVLYPAVESMLPGFLK